MYEALSMIMPVIWFIALVAAIMAFLVPFFVFRIRNELIKLNRNFSKFAGLDKIES